ncbi:hypothetical protein AB0M68_29640 [Streptomyces sp. NPDC051453]|uniref:hypothetical protein n=1 Tax=Streptomyces sp. NPDC051453 TaxID=3154941 RepID=UPI00342A3601
MLLGIRLSAYVVTPTTCPAAAIAFRSVLFSITSSYVSASTPARAVTSRQMGSRRAFLGQRPPELQHVPGEGQFGGPVEDERPGGEPGQGHDPAGGAAEHRHGDRADHGEAHEEPRNLGRQLPDRGGIGPTLMRRDVNA